MIERFSDPQARLLYEDCQVFLHYLNDGAYAARCVGWGPCQQRAISTAAGDMYRIATLERQLAAQLKTGACRAAWAQDATSHNQLGTAFLVYGHAISMRESLTQRDDRARAFALSREATRKNVPPTAFLSSCAPHGVLLGPPTVA